MKLIYEKLYALRDEKYAAFQSKLTPNVNANLFIGVRVPVVRTLAKELIKSNPEEVKEFLNELPHKYYDENMLHGILLSLMKDYKESIDKVNLFLPYVDNWAVCDIMSPVSFKKHKDELINEIPKWIKAEDEYAIRFGIEMLMSHYLDEDFKPEYLYLAASVKSDKYYINMMTAWYFATALAKQWEDAVKILTGHLLDPWVHNKTIQKAKESYRITKEQKEYLETLKV